MAENITIALSDTPERIRVLVVEDHVATLSGLVQQISADSDMTLLGYARSFDQAQELIERHDFDVLLVDMDLSGKSALPLIEQARHCAVVVLSNLGDENTVLSAIRAGACGYVLKDDALINIKDAMRSALDGESPVSSAIAGVLLREVQRRTPVVEGAALEMLSKREMQILKKLAEGLTYRLIADDLHLSYHTVSDHTKSIYRKLQVNSRGQAVAKFFHSAEPDRQFA